MSLDFWLIEPPMDHESTQVSHDEIARLAQSIWEEEGRPEGRSIEHWLRAENQLRNAKNSQPASKSIQLLLPPESQRTGRKTRVTAEKNRALQSNPRNADSVLASQ
jgi:hypothetical protein